METDFVKIETEFMKRIISKAIKKVVKKYGYDVEIRISNLQASNENGRIHAHLKADAKTSSGEFKRICKNSNLLKSLVSTVLKFDFAKKLFVNEAPKILKRLLAEKLGKVDLEIENFDYKDNGGKAHIYLDVFVKMKEEELRKALRAVI